MTLNEIERALSELRLSGIAATLNTRVMQAQSSQEPFLDTFAAMLQDELVRRRSRLTERRFKQSGLDERLSLADFDWRFNPKIPRQACFELHTLKFITEGANALIIGKPGTNIEKVDALSHVFGWTIANDVTGRDLQRRYGQWFKGKSLDGSCPLGPWIIPADELDASDLAIQLWINGEQRQSSRTSKMIFDVTEIIHHLSKGFTLLPGDVIMTGTPEGVGYAMVPPQVLKSGDVVRIAIEGIGELTNPVG